jgi:CubicO group peptidase (beta-lactamase class C family)
VAARLAAAALAATATAAPAAGAQTPSAAAIRTAAAPPAGARAGREDAAAVRARVDSLAQAYLRETRTPGLTLAVLRGRDTVAMAGYGVADRAANRPASLGTVYRVGSLTKQFTAAAVLQLVDEGRLRLTDTLGAYLPQYPQWGRVTVRQLLNHTSGIPSYTASAPWRARMAEALPPDTLLSYVANTPMRFAPGARWEYNNSGYFLLGMLLERVAGRPYAALVRERLFAPLGLRTAGYCPDRPSAADDARGYEVREGSETASEGRRRR